MMGHNNLAVSEFMLLQFTEAFEQGQRVVAIWPHYVGARVNLSLIRDVCRTIRDRP